MKDYFVRFKRIGKYRDRGARVAASGLDQLEGPIREAAEPYLGEKAQNMTVTFEKVSMKGELDYGLTGEFTVDA